MTGPVRRRPVRRRPVRRPAAEAGQAEGAALAGGALEVRLGIGALRSSGTMAGQMILAGGPAPLLRVAQLRANAWD
jgi:hypothetical protein